MKIKNGSLQKKTKTINYSLIKDKSDLIEAVKCPKDQNQNEWLGKKKKNQFFS